MKKQAAKEETRKEVAVVDNKAVVEGNKDKAVGAEAVDNSASNHSRGKIKTVNRDLATNKTVNRNLRVPVEHRPSKVDSRVIVRKTRAATNGIIIQTNNKGKTVTVQTGVADNKEEASNKDKIKIPAITAGRRNNEVLIGTSGFTPGVF